MLWGKSQAEPALLGLPEKASLSDWISVMFGIADSM